MSLLIVGGDLLYQVKWSLQITAGTEKEGSTGKGDDRPGVHTDRKGGTKIPLPPRLGVLSIPMIYSQNFCMS